MRILIVPVMLSALAFSGCATTGGLTPEQVQQAQNVIAQVQAGTKQACSFVPTAQTIASILETFGVPYVGMVTDVAGQICDAVTKTSAKRGAVVKVRGVAIKGKFVR